jgi:Transglutaminase-like superfamily
MPSTKIRNHASGGALSGCVWQKDRSGIRANVRSPSDAVLFLQISAFSAIVPCLLRLKLSRVARALEWGRRGRAALAHQDQIEKIAAYVELAIRRGHPIVRSGCLTRGLTRYYFFRRAGMDVALFFGMGRMEKGFMGHCWLVKDGEPFLELQDPRPLYAEIYRISCTGGQAAPLRGNGKQRFINA